MLSIEWTLGKFPLNNNKTSQTNYLQHIHIPFYVTNIGFSACVAFACRLQRGSNHHQPQSGGSLLCICEERALRRILKPQTPDDTGNRAQRTSVCVSVRKDKSLCGGGGGGGRNPVNPLRVGFWGGSMYGARIIWAAHLLFPSMLSFQCPRVERVWIELSVYAHTHIHTRSCMSRHCRLSTMAPQKPPLAAPLGLGERDNSWTVEACVTGFLTRRRDFSTRASTMCANDSAAMRSN